SEGARVDPDWLMKFLKDPSLMQSGETPTVAASPSPSAAASPAAEAKPSAATNHQTGGRLQPQPGANRNGVRSEEHTSELQSRGCPYTTLFRSPAKARVSILIG